MKNHFIFALNGKRLFLRFDGVNSTANVFVNLKHIGEHRGGYAAFVFEITDKVEYGKNNSLLVRANNAELLDVMPLVGDFNFYGGIYRDVHLIITEPACISLLNHASSGVYLVQESVSRDRADVTVKVNLDNRTTAQDVELRIQVKDGTKLISQQCSIISLAQNAALQNQIPISIKNPHLWNGRKDPFMYQVSIELLKDGKVLDSVKQPLGLRYYHTDPDKGFFLNGEHLTLKGVCRHQDRAEVGNALRNSHHEEDVALMLEMGVNAVRLAHYPQASYVYDLMDKYGIITWAEIPFVGPGGYGDKGFVDQPSFRENGKLQLIELIRQHYNHPSICFWGMFNELKEEGDNPIEYIKEQHAPISKDYSGMYLYYIGYAYYMQKDYDNSLKYLDLSIAKDAKNSTSHYLKASILTHLGKGDEAITCYQTAINLKPDDAAFYIGLGNLHFQHKEDDLALENYKKATENAECPITAYFMIADIYSYEKKNTIKL